MEQFFTCIMCPRGCEIKCEYEDGRIGCIEGFRCKKGKEYVSQEIVNPLRNVTASIRVLGGELPLASVRLTKPVPKKKIFEVMDVIKGITVQAPVEIGQIVLPDVCGLGSSVMVTKNVGKEEIT